MSQVRILPGALVFMQLRGYFRSDPLGAIRARPPRRIPGGDPQWRQFVGDGMLGIKSLGLVERVTEHSLRSSGATRLNTFLAPIHEIRGQHDEELPARLPLRDSDVLGRSAAGIGPGSRTDSLCWIQCTQ